MIKTRGLPVTLHQSGGSRQISTTSVMEFIPTRSEMHLRPTALLGPTPAISFCFDLVVKIILWSLLSRQITRGVYYKKTKLLETYSSLLELPAPISSATQQTGDLAGALGRLTLAKG